MSKKLILFAQHSEAVHTLEKLNAQEDSLSKAFIWSEGEIPTCYRFAEGLIIIGNVGIHYAQLAVSKHIHECDEVWNIGLAGSLNDTIPLGSLVSIEKVGKYTSLPSNLDPLSFQCYSNTLPPFALATQGVKLISSDFPIHDHTLRNSLSKEWDLVDMEGYGVAFATVHHCKPCRLWKIVSDFASPGGRELIRQNKPQLARKIAEFLSIQLYNE